MFGMITTLMTSFPVGNFIDAVFFILKGYHLDGPPRKEQTRQAIVTAGNVTGYLLGEALVGSLLAILWLINLLSREKP